ncbi:MAG TPA: XdhC family protein [Candidatus Udaeobacter sp.]|jgi:xanthine dehydrogenase accessory factor|nr:XdhC family protein [Candidatus Udaeobacter sp.]
MDMYDVLAAVMADDQRGVLATIVCVEGHSYRKTGAAMLFKQSGEQIGTVSPGCLEHDLLERAASIAHSGQFEFIDYNLNPDEDVIWGEAVGCGGEMRVLLEPIDGRLRTILIEAKERTDAGVPVRLLRSWNEKEINYTLVDDADTGQTLEISDAKDGVSNHMSFLISPRPRLVIFGVGKDAEAIYSLVKQIGFQVVVADWRPSLCTNERFPDAECVIGSPEQIAEQLQFRSDDYLIVCSHNLHQDKDMLRLALPLQLVYIGIMGSKKRIRMLFETFLIPSNVRAPIGLSVGADGPYEIAVSIAAELIAIRAGRKSRPRRERGRDAYFSPLFGSWPEQTHGSAQAVARAGEGQAASKRGTACSFVQPT